MSVVCDATPRGLAVVEQRAEVHRGLQEAELPVVQRAAVRKLDVQHAAAVAQPIRTEEDHLGAAAGRRQRTVRQPDVYLGQRKPQP